MNSMNLLIPILFPAVCGLLLPFLKPLYEKSFGRHAYVFMATLISFILVVVA